MNNLGKIFQYILIIFSLYVGLVPKRLNLDLISHSTLSRWHFWLAGEQLLSKSFAHWANWNISPLKRQTKIADDILIFYFYLSKKIRLDFSCESSA